MPINIAAYQEIKTFCDAQNATLVAVSKNKPMADITALYEMGHRDFGENYVQELLEKQAALPKDIRWHFIGHLQSNKVKQIVPFVHLIHGVDNFKLLNTINEQAEKINREIDCLLQVHIAAEDTKFGFDEQELSGFVNTVSNHKKLDSYNSIRIKGLMGMASNTTDKSVVKTEFENLLKLFAQLSSVDYPLSILSMGMSGDYKIAIEAGSNMVRIGSLLFGERNHTAK